MGGCDKIVVLCGAGHGDLVIPLAQPLEHPVKNPSDTDRPGTHGHASAWEPLVNSYLSSKLSLTSSPSLGDVIIIFDPSSIGLSAAKTVAPAETAR